MRKEIESLLIEMGVNPTPVRILVYKSLSESEKPLSLSDLETKLETVDKSTISRTLTTFKDKHLIHSFNDGSGSTKYEVCKSRKELEESDLHVHFRCENCGVTVCLTTVMIPEVKLPEGYVPREATYIVTGVCPECSK